jgi:hypothetical protein
LIDFVNSLAADPVALNNFLTANKLDADVIVVDGKVQPEALLPVAADICLRCHAPAGWLEGHSEPKTTAFDFLKGQFWGAAFLEEPADPVDLLRESEAEMEGVQCDTCHRMYDNAKRDSLFDGSTLAAGNAGYLVDLTNPFDGPNGKPTTVHEDFQKSGDFCGTCHDVTNPLIDTQTPGASPGMKHPIERTYTEWYWSGYRNTKRCQTCHEPMRFQGAQTWLLYPGLSDLWGDIDQKWVDKGYILDASRAPHLEAGAQRNRKFMNESAASISFVGTPSSTTAGLPMEVMIKVVNNTGHKLPTGFGEGRQMWLHIKAVDDKGNVLFEDGALDASGHLMRTAGVTKVYEQRILAKGYDFLDKDGDGVTSHEEQEFHFVLMNYIEKDNRIPPKGYNKAAYQADGAFIIPFDPKDTDYADGQNWDITPYTFTVPATTVKQMTVTATLYYQTFNKEYAEFLRDHDQEPTVSNGGRARDLPQGGIYGNAGTWGNALHAIWQDNGNGKPVVVGSTKATIKIN